MIRFKTKQLLSILLINLVTVVAARGDCVWDDGYSMVLRGMDFKAVRGGEARARGLIYSGFGFWGGKREYAAARELAKGLVADSDSMVRIEIGNGYAASYSLIWVIKTKIATWLISSQGERVQASQLPEQSWDRLKVAFDDAEVWSLHSAVDTAADDASTTFVSYCADDKSTQFAVYGLPTASEPTPSEHLFAEQVRGQRRVVRAVLDLVEPAVSSRTRR